MFSVCYDCVIAKVSKQSCQILSQTYKITGVAEISTNSTKLCFEETADNIFCFNTELKLIFTRDSPVFLIVL